MSNYITDIQVSRGKTDEQHYQNQGYQRIDVNLNQTGCGEEVYFWYINLDEGSPITRVQVSYNEDMAEGLINAGYTKVDNPTPGGSTGVTIWYFQGTSEYDTKIVELGVTTTAEDEAEKVCSGWERAGCNLSGANGQWFYLWVKREQQTYICDVQGTVSYGGDKDLFNVGYIRIDETTNSGSCGTCPNSSSSNFVWYRQTTDTARALTDVQVSITEDERQLYKQQRYSVVNQNLNEKDMTNPVYLWYKKGGPSPIKTMMLLLNPSAVDPYEKIGATVISKNLNIGNNGLTRNLSIFQ